MISQSTKQKNEDDKYSISEGELDLEDQCATKKNVVKLPSSHAAQELISHLLNKADESSSSSGELKAEEKIFIEEHQHPVILSKREQIQDENNGTKEEAITLVCEWCIEPISSSDLHYSCVECGYYVHFTCYKLPSELQITKHPEHPLLLRYEANAVGHFVCNACQRQSNGEFYECDRDSCELRFCIKCASASMIPNVVHAAHKHLLTQYGSSDPTKCNACGTKSDGFVFACKYCHFYLDYECALLPPATKQRWDKHPLILVYPPYFDHPEEFYCVLCEEEINPNTWMYHCRDCDYSLHPWCIPQFKLFRDLKFGRSLLVDDHPHHLTHVPEARYKSFCEACKDSLDWKESFECNSCSYYLCPDCAFEREL
ncbi:unnamed protein product [Coffea canephora]|uniref:Zinc finger PHD-type domain-containing protein n=1 Tax=Coffea canephora TaxID=49390 RepID=A0A068UDI3_COFCA|nr:unnamed protein product [Coffea canephora]